MARKTQDVSIYDEVTDNAAEVNDVGQLKVETFPATGTAAGQHVYITDHDMNYTADVTATGQLSVISPIPTTPPGADPVNEGDVYYPGKNGGEEFHYYTITNGKTLHLQRMSGGTEAMRVTGGAAGKVELWYDPDGDMGGNAVLYKVAYLNAGNFQFDLGIYVPGDGTIRIVMKATNWSSTNGVEFAMFFDAYEEDT